MALRSLRCRAVLNAARKHFEDRGMKSLLEEGVKLVVPYILEDFKVLFIAACEDGRMRVFSVVLGFEDRVSGLGDAEKTMVYRKLLEANAKVKVSIGLHEGSLIIDHWVSQLEDMSVRTIERHLLVSGMLVQWIKDVLEAVREGREPPRFEPGRELGELLAGALRHSLES